MSTIPRLFALLLAAWVMLLGAQGTLADGDPASDVLLGAPVFFPYQPPVSRSLQGELQQELAELQRRGLNLKVAIIASPVDLGAVPTMFGMPQTYARFLDSEISSGRPQPLLVVMPGGFGAVAAGPAGALAGLKVDASQRSDGLARSAITAVQRIAQASGKRIAAPRGGAGASVGSGGPSLLITVGIPVLLALLGLSIATWRFRRSHR